LSVRAVLPSARCLQPCIIPARQEVEMRVVLAAVAVAALGSLPVVAQSSSGKAVAKSGKAWSVPRTADGAPDLTGNWTKATYTPLERPANMADRKSTPPHSTH